MLTKKEMEKMGRGAISRAYTEDKGLVAWKDNKVVVVASNAADVEPLTKARRRKRGQREFTVDMPQNIALYNKYMGGVDLLDAMIAKYRIRLRSRKWYWALFSWVISALTVNAWKLFMKVTTEKIGLLVFIQQVCQEILTVHSQEKKRTGRSASEIKGCAGENIRYDGVSHWPKHVGDGKPRCRECKRRCKFTCSKCHVGLHPECFEKYHTK